ncbi:MAG: DUF177 domain-containing protein [Chloroflexi bacterium]|nr:DUF177 domain-containing protein [Chloroflexota bacterium]
MRINVAQLLKAEIGARREYELDEVVDEGAQGASIPLRGRVELLRTDRGILVQAALATEVRGRCDRCLVPVRQPLDIELEEVFYPIIDILHGGKLPDPENKDAFRIDEYNQLDLGEATRQYLIASTPMRLLCRPGCVGLCADCGANLNQGPCACPPAPVEQRWAPLRQLLEQGTFRRKQRN